MRLLWPLLVLVFVPVANCGFFDSIANFFTGNDSKKVSDGDAKTYLQSFGYVGPSNVVQTGSQSTLKTALQSAGETLGSAVKKFQEFAGIGVTGVLDDKTKAKMVEPRCGDPDVMMISSGHGAAFKWKKNEITYTIESYSEKVSKEDTKKAISEAFQAWAAVTPLKITEVKPGESADIKIRFETKYHNDPWPFEGRGGVLAHATMPEHGVLHFDDDELWTVRDGRNGDNTDLYAVAIHETGHTLGMSHSREHASVMAPFYQKTTDGKGNYVQPHISSSDITEIQAIYGKGKGKVTPTLGAFIEIPSNLPSKGASKPPARNSGCPGAIDAIASALGKSYIFNGSRVFTIDTSSKQIMDASPVTEIFPAGPHVVHAAVYNPGNSRMLLFNTGKVWAFVYSLFKNSFELENGYPKKLPSDMNWSPIGAFRWKDGKQILTGPANNLVEYDDVGNKVKQRGKVEKFFPNFPNDVRGFMPSIGETVVGFTISTGFTYNSRTMNLLGKEIPVRNYFNCANQRALIADNDTMDGLIPVNHSTSVERFQLQSYANVMSLTPFPSYTSMFMWPMLIVILARTS